MVLACLFGLCSVSPSQNVLASDFFGSPNSKIDQLNYFIADMEHYLLTGDSVYISRCFDPDYYEGSDDLGHFRSRPLD